MGIDEGWKLHQKQSLPLEAKIILSQRRIKEWYEHWDGMVYVSFSGGKDSTVMLHLVRQMYPEVPAVFVDTGLEFPEIRDFVKTWDNVEWLKPKMLFSEVIEKYGYPVVSKKVSMGLSRHRCTKSEEQRQLRLHGGICPGSGKKQARTIPIKYHYLVDAPFKISEQCCDVMKKSPLKKYSKNSGRKPFIGTMALDSDDRRQQYHKHGCNVFDAALQQSKPLSVWSEDDIWEYLRTYSVPYSTVYDMGYDRTGCVFCMFGCQLEKENRFVRLYETHPKLHSYCMDKLGIRNVLEFMGIDPGGQKGTTHDAYPRWANTNRRVEVKTETIASAGSQDNS